MNHRIRPADSIGTFPPIVAVASVAATLVLLGTTARGDSSSGSSGISTGTSSAGAPSVGSTLTLGKSADLSALGGNRPGMIGDSRISRDPVGAPDLGEPLTSALRATSNQVATFTDLPPVDDPDALPTERRGAADTGAPGRASLVGGLVRLLVFGVLLVLLMRYLQRRWNPRSAIADRPGKDRGRRVGSV
jgi:hypothetical protein